MHQTLVLGVGSIGERHLRCFLQTGRTKVGFVEVRSDLTQTIKERYPGVSAYLTLEQALQEHWDTAVVATPAPLHIPQALQLVQHRISVLIEKPLSVSLDGVTDLISTAQKHDVVCSVAYVHRANPVLVEMRRELLSGRFGKPVQLVATSGQDFPKARPAYAEIYYAHRHLGGGAVQDALTHIVNLAEWLIGPADRVAADINHQVLPGVDVEDTTHVIARHGNVMASYALNQYQAPTELVVSVVCERATVRFEGHRSRWSYMEQSSSEWVESAPVALERDQIFQQQANAFLDAAQYRHNPLCSLQEGRATLQFNLAVLKSAQTQAWCDVS